MNKSNVLREHIAEAVKTLQVSTDDFHLVSLYKYEDILVSILNKFTVLDAIALNFRIIYNE